MIPGPMSRVSVRTTSGERSITAAMVARRLLLAGASGTCDNEFQVAGAEEHRGDPNNGNC